MWTTTKKWIRIRLAWGREVYFCIHGEDIQLVQWSTHFIRLFKNITFPRELSLTHMGKHLLCAKDVIISCSGDVYYHTRCFCLAWLAGNAGRGEQGSGQSELRHTGTAFPWAMQQPKQTWWKRRAGPQGRLPCLRLASHSQLGRKTNMLPKSLKSTAVIKDRGAKSKVTLVQLPHLFLCLLVCLFVNLWSCKRWCCGLGTA